MFLAIASIVDDESIIGYRMYSALTEKWCNATVESVQKSVDLVVNMEVKEGILYCKDKLTTLRNNEIIGKEHLIILKRLENNYYKVVDYKGNCMILTLREINMIEGTNKQVVVSIGYKEKVDNGTNVINTTSRSNTWGKEFSPFYLKDEQGRIIENVWQYSKVYQQYVNENKEPTKEYYAWAKEGFSNQVVVRYPMGKGAVPLYSLWNGKKLSYTEARREIYIPMYARAVVETEAFKRLSIMYNNGEDIVLRDFDGYNHRKLKMSYDDVIDCKYRKMGHSFVILMLLEGKIEVQGEDVIIH